MKRTELKNCDIVVCDYRMLGRPVVYYVVMGEVMVSFKGDVNCGKRPQGWYQVNEDELPMDCVKVYRPKHITNTFNGDFENTDIYECIYSKGE
jgi:hypothetical protein